MLNQTPVDLVSALSTVLPGACGPPGGQVDAGVLEAALDAGGLVVHYQPIVVLPSRHVAGFEALARLRLADGSLLLPDRFIPVAERCGLIFRLGESVLRQALTAAAGWRRASALIGTATVSVNVAAAQLAQRGFVELVAGVLEESGLPGSVLVLEITETSVASPTVRPVLERLSDMGVRIALDDFGVGFATLDNVRRLPVHVLKLDRSFVGGMTASGTDRAIVRVVIDLADSLGMSVVAEGVESEAQLETLVQLRCPGAQGDLFARPGGDPEQVAAGVYPGAEPARVVRGYPWPAEVDGQLLAALQLLSPRGDPVRDAVHCVALELGRGLGLDPTSMRVLSHLALLYDLDRLTVDRRHPEAFCTHPTLAALLPAGSAGAVLGAAATSDGSGAGERVAALPGNPGDEDDRLLAAIVKLASRSARRAAVGAGEGPLVPPSLSLALRAELDAGGVSQGLSRVADRVAARPLEPVDTSEVIQDLSRRRAGRLGMAERVRSLVGITRVMASSRDNRELLRVALEEARRVIGAASASLERWDRDHGHLRCLVNVGELGPGEEVFPDNEIYPLAEYAQARRTLLTGLPYLHTLDDVHADPEAVTLLAGLEKYSSAAVPISLEGRLWGQLWVSAAPGEPPFVAADVELLMAVATLMGSVIVQAENLDRMSRLAFEDPLTRVGNRRCIDDVLARLAAEGRPAAAVLLDVDLLKQINDREGHARGDQALIRLADALSAGLADRPGTTIGRLGGDEFCVIFDDADVDEATRRIRCVLHDLQTTGGPTASMGVAVSEPGWEPRQLLATADTHLYKAKRRRYAHRFPTGS
jgi:diguanylate cyclase (GGDEF)-like protein